MSETYYTLLGLGIIIALIALLFSLVIYVLSSYPLYNDIEISWI